MGISAKTVVNLLQFFFKIMSFWIFHRLIEIALISDWMKQIEQFERLIIPVNCDSFLKSFVGPGLSNRDLPRNSTIFMFTYC